MPEDMMTPGAVGLVYTDGRLVSRLSQLDMPCRCRLQVALPSHLRGVSGWVEWGLGWVRLGVGGVEGKGACPSWTWRAVVCCRRRWPCTCKGGEWDEGVTD